MNFYFGLVFQQPLVLRKCWSTGKPCLIPIILTNSWKWRCFSHSPSRPIDSRIANRWEIWTSLKLYMLSIRRMYVQMYFLLPCSCLTNSLDNKRSLYILELYFCFLTHFLYSYAWSNQLFEVRVVSKPDNYCKLAQIKVFHDKQKTMSVSLDIKFIGLG